MIGDIQQATGHGIHPICATLRVPRSSYYHAVAPTPTPLSDHQTGDVIEAVFKRHRRRYDYRRIWQELQRPGAPLCYWSRPSDHDRAWPQSPPAQDLRPRTSNGRADKPSPNLLLDQPFPGKPNQVWAAVIDLC